MSQKKTNLRISQRTTFAKRVQTSLEWSRGRAARLPFHFRNVVFALGCNSSLRIERYLAAIGYCLGRECPAQTSTTARKYWYALGNMIAKLLLLYWPHHLNVPWAIVAAQAHVSTTLDSSLARREPLVPSADPMSSRVMMRGKTVLTCVMSIPSILSGFSCLHSFSTASAS